MSKAKTTTTIRRKAKDTRLSPRDRWTREIVDGSSRQLLLAGCSLATVQIDHKWKLCLLAPTSIEFEDGDFALMRQTNGPDDGESNSKTKGTPRRIYLGHLTHDEKDKEAFALTDLKGAVRSFRFNDVWELCVVVGVLDTDAVLGIAHL